MNLLTTIKKQFLCKILLTFLIGILHVGTLQAQPSPDVCAECELLAEDQIDACMESHGCGVAPVTGNMWVLALGGLFLAYFAYGRHRNQE